jgi:hypothetical protein
MITTSRFGGEGQEAQEQFLIPRLFALEQQRLHVVRRFKILIAVVAPDMLGDQFLVLVDQHSFGKPL